MLVVAEWLRAQSPAPVRQRIVVMIMPDTSKPQNARFERTRALIEMSLGLKFILHSRVLSDEDYFPSLLREGRAPLRSVDLQGNVRAAGGLVT